MSPHFLARLEQFADHPYIGEARGVGLIGALELVADKQSKAGFAQPGSVGAKLAELCHEEGLIIRAIGEIIAFCPPLIITEKEIDEMFDRFGRALKRLPIDEAKAP